MIVFQCDFSFQQKSNHVNAKVGLKSPFKIGWRPIFICQSYYITYIPYLKFQVINIFSKSALYFSGPIPFIVVGEIFRQEPRAAAMSLSLTFNWVCNFILMMVFRFMQVSSLTNIWTNYVFPPENHAGYTTTNLMFYLRFCFSRFKSMNHLTFYVFQYRIGFYLWRDFLLYCLSWLLFDFENSKEIKTLQMIILLHSYSLKKIAR